MKKRWNICCIPEEKIQTLINCNGFPRAIALILAARGITPENLQNFINPTLSSLTDPYRFPDLKKAAARLWEAIKEGEEIIIHGDYDTDGITSATLLEWVLVSNGGKVKIFLPDRFDDGYGFTPESMEKCIRKSESASKKLLVTVDCGITSVEAVARAKEKGIDVIITDHHDPCGSLPDAYAVINPKLHETLEDLHILSGVGVTFKLAHGFIKFGRENGLGGFATDLKEILDLVALGTIADIVPLFRENRVLVKHGIKHLEKQVRPGIRALIEAAKLDMKIKPIDVTFKLAPRLNAAGRLGDPFTALNLLRTNNIVEAYKYSQKLEEYNKLRQAKEETIYREAVEYIERNYDVSSRLTFTVAGKDWHLGVVGIVASKLAKEYNRPVIVLSIDGDTACGSGRSPGSINMMEVLRHCCDCLTKFGGHPMAVGLTLNTNKINKLSQSFEQFAREYISMRDLVEEINIDGEAELEEIDDRFFEHIELLEPFGHSNPQPTLLFRNLTPVWASVVAERHTRGILSDKKNNTIKFILFNRHLNSLPKGDWDIVAIPHINEFRNSFFPQLMIVDVELAE